jgi:hypothetical protein
VRLLEVRAEGVLDVLGVVDEVQDDEVGLGLAVGGAVEAGEGLQLRGKSTRFLPFNTGSNGPACDPAELSAGVSATRRQLLDNARDVLERFKFAQ